MAKYNSVVITNAGQQVLFEALSSTYKIRFTAMAFGAGKHFDGDLAALTQLEDERQRVAITDAAVYSSDSVTVKARLDNTSLATGYRINEIGIYCRDASGDSSPNEVLYAVVTAAVADYMPAEEQGAPPVEFAYQFGLAVGVASEVTVEAAGNGYYTQDEVDALLENYYTKAEIDALLNGNGGQE